MIDEVRMTLRLPEDLRDRLRAHAKSERRSLNSELVYMLEVGLRASGVNTESPGGDSATSAPLRGKPGSSPT
ncbi:Arc family DNA-binding protein [Streptomyces sp. ISL-100]|uniref:Arc family DNA-binding protein n=1 Tax=Streptomyces sp. ISL-100 TaxID=2819173 RepID=UPI001BE5AA17|nr:Arc family DNA-binding protein [Streptomyces sp. ISL-100]MBT2396488.1 Arc family DNA-binding protein [Streptomyces sp. ISL-100]